MTLNSSDIWYAIEIGISPKNLGDSFSKNYPNFGLQQIEKMLITVKNNVISNYILQLYKKRTFVINFCFAISVYFCIFGGSDFSRTVLHFRNTKLKERYSFFMHLHLYLSGLYEKAPKK